MANLQSTDLILVGREGTSYQTSFNELKDSVFSGSYNDLSDQPDIPETTSQLINDSGFITSADVPDSDVDAYTKVESDAKYIAKNISSLTELPTS